MSAARWTRLVETLAAAGIEAKVTERPYSQSVYGRVEHGVSRSIILRTASGCVVIGDQWWRKNPSIWLGWEVHVEDREGFAIRQCPLTKKRAEVRDAVLAAVAIEVRS